LVKRIRINPDPYHFLEIAFKASANLFIPSFVYFLV
jgi:hypothetical protein